MNKLAEQFQNDVVVRYQQKMAELVKRAEDNPPQLTEDQQKTVDGFNTAARAFGDYLSPRMNAISKAVDVGRSISDALNPPLETTLYRSTGEVDGQPVKGRTHVDLKRGHQTLSTDPIYDAADYIRNTMYNPAARMLGLPKADYNSIDITNVLPSLNSRFSS